MEDIDSIAESTLRPEHVKTETIAEIKIIQDTINIYFPEKREDFRQIIRYKLGYDWNGFCWSRTINKYNGTLDNCTAEAGHRLLASGFIVRIANKEIRDKIISGQFERECKRWIKSAVNDSYKDWFYLTWERDVNFYDNARRIKGSRYNSGSILIPPEQYEQLLDFASLYGFRFSERAQEIVDMARKVKENSLIIKVPEVQEVIMPLLPGERPSVLDIPEDIAIDDDFKDEE